MPRLNNILNRLYFSGRKYVWTSGLLVLYLVGRINWRMPKIIMTIPKIIVIIFDCSFTLTDPILFVLLDSFNRYWMWYTLSRCSDNPDNKHTSLARWSGVIRKLDTTSLILRCFKAKQTNISHLMYFAHDSFRIFLMILRLSNPGAQVPGKPLSKPFELIFSQDVHTCPYRISAETYRIQHLMAGFQPDFKVRL